MIADATSEISTLEELSTATQPLWGYRLALGPSRLCVLILEGTVGWASFDALIPEFDENTTLHARYGDDVCAIFRQPTGMKRITSAKKLAPVVSVLGDGDSCVVPPSGSAFWSNPGAEIEALPHLLRELAFENPANPPGRTMPVPKPFPVRIRPGPQRAFRSRTADCGRDKRYSRRGLSECMLGKGVIIVEGLTEFHALPVLARCLEAQDSSLNPLDLAGVSIFDAESDGPIPKFGKFSQALGLKTFGFYDAKQRTQDEKNKFAAVLDVNEEHPYKGFEGLLAAETPGARLRSFLQDLLDSGVDAAHYGIPATLPADDTTLRKLVTNVLASSKGAGWAARLLEQCDPNELPKTAVDFLKEVYAFFPIPIATPAGTPGQTP
jgi:hypothetical protein